MKNKKDLNYVTFEQAVWLKENGFDTECESCYHSFLKIGEDNDIKTPLVREFTQRKFQNSTINKDNIARPLQYQVNNWLLINHGIWVSISPTHTDDKWGYELSSYEIHPYEGWYGEVKKWNFNSPQEAMSGAFDYIILYNQIEKIKILD